jgi:hypothetical protein
MCVINKIGLVLEMTGINGVGCVRFRGPICAKAAELIVGGGVTQPISILFRFAVLACSLGERGPEAKQQRGRKSSKE